MKGTKKLKDFICAQNWKPVEVGGNISNNQKVIESQFWNLQQEHSEIWHIMLKSLKVTKVNFKNVQ